MLSWEELLTVGSHKPAAYWPQLRWATWAMQLESYCSYEFLTYSLGYEKCIFSLTQSNFLSWVSILSNVENQSNHFWGTWSSSWIIQSIQDFISVTYSLQMLTGTCFPSCQPWEQGPGGTLPGLLHMQSSTFPSPPLSPAKGWSDVLYHSIWTFFLPSQGCPFAHTHLSTPYLLFSFLAPTVALGSPHVPFGAAVGSLPHHVYTAATGWSGDLSWGGRLPSIAHSTHSLHMQTPEREWRALWHFRLWT